MDTARKPEYGDADDKQIKRITCFSIFANAVLMAAKLVIGLISGSLAIIADAIHSLSDFVTDIGVIIGVHFGSKEPDADHPYGHGRLETFSAVFVAVSLLAVGIGMVFYAAKSIAKNDVIEPNPAMYAVTILSIAVKEWLYRITKNIAIKTKSSATYANAWHHRSDALSSITVLIGIIALKFGFGYGDHVAAIAVGLMIISVAVNIISKAISELAEGAVDVETYARIKEIINSNGRIHNWHKLRTRTVGREIFLDLHILVDPTLDIKDAHQIAEDLENTIHARLTRPVNIIVHIEPDLPELRK